MHLPRLSEMSTMLALCNRTSFLLDFEKSTIGMGAGRRAMSLDTGFAVRVFYYFIYGNS